MNQHNIDIKWKEWVEHLKHQLLNTGKIHFKPLEGSETIWGLIGSTGTKLPQDSEILLQGNISMVILDNHIEIFQRNIWISCNKPKIEQHGPDTEPREEISDQTSGPATEQDYVVKMPPKKHYKIHANVTSIKKGGLYEKDIHHLSGKEPDGGMEEEA